MLDLDTQVIGKKGIYSSIIVLQSTRSSQYYDWGDVLLRSADNLNFNIEDYNSVENACNAVEILRPGYIKRIYVDGRQNGFGDDNQHNGTSSWNEAYRTLEKAFKKAVEVRLNNQHPQFNPQIGTLEIWLIGGENGDEIVYPAPANIDMPAGVAIYGGFRGNEEVCAERDSKNYRSVIRGPLSLEPWDPNYVDKSGETAIHDCIIDGSGRSAIGIKCEQGLVDWLTLSNCQVRNCTTGLSYAGPRNETTILVHNCEIYDCNEGISIIGSNPANSRVTIINSKLNQNTRGAYLEDISLNLKNCSLLSNVSCGARLKECDVDLLNCTISGNGDPCQPQLLRGGLLLESCKAIEIDQCNFSNNKADDGGGLWIKDGTKRAYIENSQFVGNEVNKKGGGISLYNTNYEILDCQFVGNKAVEGGGGLRCWTNPSSSYAAVARCFFIDNQVTDAKINEGGAGVSLRAFYRIQISRCVFERNHTAGSTYQLGVGGGISSVSAGDVLVFDCTFLSNTSDYRGAAIHHLGSNYNMEIRNTVFHNCAALETSTFKGKIVHATNSSVLKMYYCKSDWIGDNFNENFIEDSFSKVDNGYGGKIGVQCYNYQISSEKLSPFRSEHDYHLSPPEWFSNNEHPLIDQGLNKNVKWNKFDIDGDWPIPITDWDIGADEYNKEIGYTWISTQEDVYYVNEDPNDGFVLQVKDANGVYHTSEIAIDFYGVKYSYSEGADYITLLRKDSGSTVGEKKDIKATKLPNFNENEFDPNTVIYEPGVTFIPIGNTDLCEGTAVFVYDTQFYEGFYEVQLRSFDGSVLSQCQFFIDGEPPSPNPLDGVTVRFYPETSEPAILQIVSGRAGVPLFLGDDVNQIDSLNPVQYQFVPHIEFPGPASDWLDYNEFTVSDWEPGAVYVYAARARFIHSLGLVTDLPAHEDLSAWKIGLTQPVLEIAQRSDPNVLVRFVPPDASKAFDPSEDTVNTEYYFENTITANNSGWIDTPYWTDTAATTDSAYRLTFRYLFAGYYTTSDSSEGISISSVANNVDDTLPPHPNPLTWAEEPYTVDQGSISMRATLAADLSEGIQYEFKCVNDTSYSSGWQVGPVYAIAGLNTATTYTFQVRAKDSKAQSDDDPNHVTLWSTSCSVRPDNTIPTVPTWVSMQGGDYQVTMEASATDNDPDLEYQFRCFQPYTRDSAWQSSGGYTDRWLEESMSYTYICRVRDGAGNISDWSESMSATTLVDYIYPSPDPMEWDPNEPLIYVGTTKAIVQCVQAVSNGGLHEYEYVCTSDPNLTTDWLVDEYIHEITGLQPGTTYSFKVRACKFGRPNKATDYTTSVLSFTTNTEPAEVNRRARNLMNGVWFDSIDTAIFEAVDDQAIEILPGVHQTQVYIEDKSIILRCTDPDDPEIVAATEINSNGAAPVVWLESQGCRLEGLTITGANDPNVYTGGVLVGTFSEATLEHCVVSYNSGHGVSGGELTIRDCNIVGNSGIGVQNVKLMVDTIVQDNYNGGASMAYGGGTVINCIFRNNIAVKSGGGLTVSNEAKVLSCVFSGNDANEYGGGLMQWGDDLTLTNCTFVNNEAGDSGGGLECRGYLSPTNCIFWGNDAIDPNGGDQIGGLPIQSPTACVIQNAGGSDPQFVDEYHISETSPCCDAGSHPGELPITDIDGNLRILGGVVDIGADEFYDPDLTPPDPNVMTWAVEPNYINPSTIRMEATTATDISGPVVYYIQCPNDPNLDSGWQLDTDYTVTDVSSAMDLSFRVKVRDAAGNETDWSSRIIPETRLYNAYNRDQYTWHIGIQTAIDAANSGDTIEIIEGTHTEDDTITIYGKDIELQGSDPEDPNVIMFTRISGVNSHRVIYVENASCEIRGLTICDGQIGNHRGGGIYCDDGALTMSDCIVEDCNAMYGGGVSVQESHATLTRCLLAYNSSTVGYGGGIQVYGDGTENLTLEGCVLHDNESAPGGTTLGDGGGLYFQGEQLTMTNCSFIDNVAGDEGGGLAIGNSSMPDPIVQNCLFWGNTAPTDPATAQISGDDTKLYACLVQNAYQSGGYINDNGGTRIATYGGDGFLSTDPNLTDTYNLTAGSACIDAADDTSEALALARDLHGDLRKVGPDIDIGADEYHIPPVTLLAEALDVNDIYVQGWSWAWSKQSTTTYDGVDAAQSEPIGLNQSVAMTTQVTGPCNLQFQWKVSSRYGYHLLEFYIDEERQAYISGEPSNWLTVDCNIYEPGWHDLKWRYVKDNNFADNDDCGWVDQLVVDHDALGQVAQIQRTGAWYGTIQAAIDDSEEQDVIVIAQGTHNECLSISSLEDLTLRSTDPDDWLVVNNTVIDGTTSSHIPVLSAHESVTLEGLTITGGVNFNGSGGGIYCGSGCYYLALHNCVVSGNTATHGGGLCGFDTTMTLTNCIIEDNRSFNEGGGLYADDLFAQNCVFQDNEAYHSGGGIFISDSLNLENCTVINNESTIKSGGGIGGDNPYSAELTNCILWGNVGGYQKSSQIGGMAPDITQSFIANAYASGSTVYDSTTDAVIGYGSGTLWLDVNPLLDGYHLTAVSPCVDEGVSILELPDEDIDGDQRVLDGTVDIGADELLPVTLGPLAEALDCTFSFSTGGSGGEWFKQTSEYYQDNDAAQSEDIDDYEDAWMETTLQGPGSGSFYWKASSENGCDRIEFYIDNVWQASLSGTQDWQQKTFTLSSSGSYDLKWRYVKDGSVTVGDDCGWIDALVYTPY